jgi:hypothetical protein
MQVRRERGQCILFSVVFTPFFSSHNARFRALSVVFNLNLHCIAGASLSIHMMGEVSWDPKRRRSRTSYVVFNPLCGKARAGATRNGELS